MSSRVVVTGIGILTGNASNLVEFQGTLLRGISALGVLRGAETSGWVYSRGAQVDRGVLESKLGAVEGNQDHAMPLYAAEEALASSGLSADQRARCALVLGCVLYPGRNRVTEIVRTTFGLSPLRYTVDSACSSGAHAIAMAWKLVKRGKSTTVLVLSYNTMLLKDVAGLYKLGILTNQPVRPFDKHRAGTQPGEGSGALVLEEREHAIARGATIYAEVCGVGLGSDAFDIIPPSSDGRGLTLAMASALRSANLSPAEVRYVNAHGTGTRLNDPSESAAIRGSLLGAGETVAVSSTKPITGHTLGAAGMIEAIATVLSTQHDFIPATLNYEVSDPDCAVQVSHSTQHCPVDVALSNSSGFGGLYACIAFAKMSYADAGHAGGQLCRAS
jgi:3-oxoacyl-(acyl-carrier-protein) synthase